MNTHIVKILLLIGLAAVLMMAVSPANAQEKNTAQVAAPSDAEKLEEARKVFNEFREQSASLNRSQVSKLNYVSMYRSNLRNALLWSVRLAYFGDCNNKVDQYKTGMKFKYKDQDRLNEEKDQKIDDWGTDILNRCREHETDLTLFIEDAISTCEDSLEKFAFNNTTSMVNDKATRESMASFLNLDPSYEKFKEEQAVIQEYYPDIYAQLSTEVNRWMISGQKKSDKSGLPAME